jgi:hypothetical protein
MPTPSRFADRLRALDGAATPGPWEHDFSDGWHEVFQESTGDLVANVRGGDPPTDMANSDILVLLRNSTPRLLALIEAAQVLNDCEEHEDADFPPKVSMTEAFIALRAALTALDTVPS